MLGRYRIPVLLTLAAAFLALAWFSRTATGSDLDLWLLQRFQSVGDAAAPPGPGWLREAVRDVTALGSISVLLFSTLMAAGWFLLIGSWRVSLGMVLVIGGGIALSFLLKLAFGQPRPDLLEEPTLVFTASFPSSHAMSSLVTFTTIAHLLGLNAGQRHAHRYLLTAAVVVSLIAGLSRLYLGVHWPSDVLGGWLAGIFWLTLAWVVCDRWLLAPTAGGIDRT